MRRTSLVLFVIAPLLLLLLLVQLADTRVAPTLQADSTPAATPTGADTTPLPEPTEPAANADDPATDDPAADATPEADELAPSSSLTASQPLSPALRVRIRSQVPFTVAFALADTGAAVAPAAENSPDAPLLSAEPLTTTLPATTAAATTLRTTLRPGAAATTPLTTGALITGAELLTDVLIPLTGTLATTAAAQLDDVVALTLTAGTTGTGAITGAEVATLELPEGLLESEPTPTPSAASEEAPLLTVPDDVLTATVDSSLAATPDVAAGIPMTLEFDIQLLLTDTLTSTVPATLVLRLNGMPTMTVPISVVFGTVGTALVNVEPVTLTAALTDVTIGVTEAVTVGEVIT
ncbi:MAG: hypothetical protein ACRC1H_02455, partial [Caldilineaceae bacterium]